MRWCLLLTPLVAVACGSSPAAPTPAPVTLQAVTIAGAQTLTTKFQSLQLTATVTLSDRSTMDRTTQAAWASSDPSLVSVTAGFIVAQRSGTATITATYQGLTGTATIPVVIACEVNNTASASFRNEIASTSLDIVWDGGRLVSLAPHETSAVFAVSAGVPHVLDFFAAGSPTNRLCASSRPILPQCSSVTISCP